MQQGTVTMADIRADLGSRVARLHPQTDTSRIVREIDSIRRIAAANGLLPAVAVARSLELALARGERGPLIRGWLAVLDDAIGCETQDVQMCDLLAAACAVRFAS